MAMTTPTIRPTTTTFGSCAAERETTAALFCFAALWRAYLACRRRKQGTAQAQRYALRLLDHIDNTALALQNRCYRPARSLCFVAIKPKAREIHAARFADRVVHHLLVPELEAVYEPVFIHDLYSNRKNKGTHAAVRRLQVFMRRLHGQGGTPCPSDAAGNKQSAWLKNGWFLQLDIRNFFVSINRRILFEMIRNTLHKKYRGGAARLNELCWLTRLLLTGNPAQTAIRQGSPADFARVPAHKQLANAAPEHGLPIGNLTSQFFANVYLNELDQFVKHQLKCRYYIRYVDDFILLHPDRAQLLIWRQAIIDFLARRLNLQLKTLAMPQPVDNGADFLGYIVRPDYCLVRRRVVHNLHEKLHAFEKQLSPEPGRLILPADVRQQLHATLASYLGHFRHAQSERLLRSLWRRFSWLACFFERRMYQLLPRWQPRSVTSFRSQWRYFARQWPGYQIWIQLGRYGYLFDETAEVLSTLPLVPGLEREPSPVNGFQACLRMRTQVVPARMLPALRRQRQPYCWVVEAGYLRGGMKLRILRELFSPQGSGESG